MITLCSRMRVWLVTLSLFGAAIICLSPDWGGSGGHSHSCVGYHHAWFDSPWWWLSPAMVNEKPMG
jgi:hypothetical protein